MNRDENQFVCTNCGSTGGLQKLIKGSLLLELFLWLCGILPGLIYHIYRSNSKYYGCRACHSKSIVPVHSPAGVKILEKQNSYKTKPLMNTLDQEFPSLDSYIHRDTNNQTILAANTTSETDKKSLATSRDRSIRDAAITFWAIILGIAIIGLAIYFSGGQ